MSRELTPQEIAERSLIKTYRKELWNPFIAAVKRYELVLPGDRIAVCISGGKDSVLLAKLMQELQKHTDQPFALEFLVMDPGYNPANRALIEENAARLGIPITIFDSDIFDVTVQVEKNPCYRFTEERDGSGDGIGESKRQEMKVLLRQLKQTNPNIEKSMFRAIQGVQLDTFPGFKYRGQAHSFLDHYGDPTDIFHEN